MDSANSLYESGRRQRHVDYAIRYSHSVGLVDFGLSGFKGTVRSPTLRPVAGNGGSPTELIPYYEQISQVGLDVQLTLESALLKFEAIGRDGELNKPGAANNFMGSKDNYDAYVIGGEYSFYSVFGTDSDLTLVGEWNYDSRGRSARTSLERDWFFGTRFAFNDTQDTELKVGMIEDSGFDSTLFTAEFNRRISDSYSLELELFKKYQPGSCRRSPVQFREGRLP